MGHSPIIMLFRLHQSSYENRRKGQAGSNVGQCCPILQLSSLLNLRKKLNQEWTFHFPRSLFLTTRRWNKTEAHNSVAKYLCTLNSLSWVWPTHHPCTKVGSCKYSLQDIIIHHLHDAEPHIFLQYRSERPRCWFHLICYSLKTTLWNLGIVWLYASP